MQGATLKLVVEWAKKAKLTTYRFHAENETHTIKVVLQYVTEKETFNVMSEVAKKKKAPKPKPVDIPVSSDTVT